MNMSVYNYNFCDTSDEASQDCKSLEKVTCCAKQKFNAFPSWFETVLNIPSIVYRILTVTVMDFDWFSSDNLQRAHGERISNENFLLQIADLIQRLQAMFCQRRGTWEFRMGCPRMLWKSSLNSEKKKNENSKVSQNVEILWKTSERQVERRNSKK